MEAYAIAITNFYFHNFISQKNFLKYLLLFLEIPKLFHFHL